MGMELLSFIVRRFIAKVQGLVFPTMLIKDFDLIGLKETWLFPETLDK